MKRLLAFTVSLLLLVGTATAEIDWTTMTDEEISAALADGQAELDNRQHADSPNTESQYETLQKGSKGDAVKALQARLIELNYLSGSADGDYGAKTVSAIELFQKAANITATGIADEATQLALFDINAPKAKVYQKLNYKAISRSPDEYEGEYYTFSGTVLQVLEEEQADGTTLVEFRVATKDGYDDVVYVGYYRDSSEARILEDDKVTIYGQSLGLTPYETVMGDTVTIPLFLAESVSIK